MDRGHPERQQHEHRHRNGGARYQPTTHHGLLPPRQGGPKPMPAGEERATRPVPICSLKALSSGVGISRIALMTGPAHGRGGGSTATGILTFLIADVRGYTSFTQEHGDEAAAQLAATFAEIAREGVEAYGGRVVELRGDEALAVFTSPRQALRAAVELQAAFADETELN